MSRETSRNIFIHGIPINLEKNGLINIFCKAGEVEEAKIIQPTASNSNITYGFIKFKNATQASTAIEMFDNYKIDNHRLSVRFSKQNKENSDEKQLSSNINSNNNNDNNAFDDDDWETVDPKSILPKPRSSSKISTSESLPKIHNFDYDFSTPFDMSKPYARRMVEKYLKKIEDFNERRSHKKAPAPSIEPSEKPQIGQMYKVNITHVNTPSNFFVQLLSTVNSTANMLNNLDNHYRNEILDDPELKNGFSAAPKGSIRCKLHNLRYLKHETEWSPKAIEIIEHLSKIQQSENSEISLQIKIYDVHVFDPESNRFDAIYSVDLGFDNEEWVSSYLIDENLALKIKPDEELIKEKSLIENKTSSAVNHSSSSVVKSSTQITSTATSSKFAPQSIQQEEKNSQSSVTITTQIVKSTSSVPISKYPIKPVEMETLKKGTFTVQLQHFDDTYVDNHFYLTLKDNLDALIQLDELLQKEVKDLKKFTVISRFDQIRVGDKMEALFDIDEKWYRVSVRNIDTTKNHFDIYFLDFGNSQRINSNSNEFKNGKLLRIRNYYDSQEESKIFDLKYQAIKCRYAVYTNNKCDIKYKNTQEFLDPISEQQLDEFDIRVINVSEDYDEDKFELTRVSYGVYLINKDENNNDPVNDDEVSSILDKKETLIKPQAVYGSPKQIEPHSEQEIQPLNSYNLKQLLKNDSNSLYIDILKKDSIHKAILILTQNTRQFYVHEENSIINLFKCTTLMRNLLNNIPAPPVQSNNKMPLYQLGDFVFVLHINDWKRAIVIDIYHNKCGENNLDDLSTSFSSQLDSKSENDLNISTSSFKLNKDQSNTDGYTYKVYLVDYGSTEAYITSKTIRPIKCILDKNISTNLSENELKSLIEYPMMAVCCEFDSNIVKDSIYNAEILKSFMKDYISFKIRIKSVTKQDLFTAKLNPDDKEETRFQIRKYVISLYSNEQLLDEKFEKINDKSVVASLPPKPPIRVTPSPPPVLFETKLEKDSQHQVGLTFFGDQGELYVNLVSCVESLSHLESKIKLKKDQIELNAGKLLNWLPNLGDLVLAKYYQEQQPLSTSHYDWYRALVTKVDFKKTPNRFEVLYLDYGNSQKDLLLTDLVKLPNEFDLNKFNIFSYHVNLNNIKLDLNNELHDRVLNEFLTNESFCMKVIDNTKPDSYNLTQYDIELWTPDQKLCLNKLIDPKYKTRQIETINLVEIYENSKQKPFKISTKYTYAEDVDKEFYFVLEQDMDERNKLNLEINQHYTSKELAKETLPLEKNFKINEYYACLSDNNWYRVKITSLTNDSVSVFFIDYGFDEKIDLSSINMRLRKLNQKFMKQPQFCFGAYLFDSKRNERLIFDSKLNTNDLSNVIEEFLSVDIDNLNMSVYTKNENDLFGVVIYNKKEHSLNSMLIEEAERLINKKPPRPNLIKLTHADMPIQRSNLVVRPEKDTFMAYVQKMDYFYIFENDQVVQIQTKVQDICDEILNQESSLEFDNSIDTPKIGDLCFGKYENDQLWYRCMINNVDIVNKNYELFFLDFGNVEITKREDMLFGFNQEHCDIFRKEQPAAYKCKLYDLMPANGNSTFDKEVNAKFKDLVDNNIFIIDVIRINEDSIYEIEMNEIDPDRLEQRIVIKHLHDYLIKSKMVEFPRFDVCLTNLKSKNQLDFYLKLMKRFSA